MADHREKRFKDELDLACATPKMDDARQELKEV